MALALALLAAASYGVSDFLAGLVPLTDYEPDDE